MNRTPKLIHCPKLHPKIPLQSRGLSSAQMYPHNDNSPSIVSKANTGPREKVLYRLEKETLLIPNQIVRLIASLKELGIELPSFTDVNELNQHLLSLQRRAL